MPGLSCHLSCYLGLSCGMWDLASGPGIKPALPPLEPWSLSHWTTRELPILTSEKSPLTRYTSLPRPPPPASWPCQFYFWRPLNLGAATWRESISSHLVHLPALPTLPSPLFHSHSAAMWRSPTVQTWPSQLLSSVASCCPQKKSKYPELKVFP